MATAGRSKKSALILMVDGFVTIAVLRQSLSELFQNCGACNRAVERGIVLLISYMQGIK